MKRGIFFSIDALLSFTIILMIILLAFPLVKLNKYDAPIARDILVTLSSLKIGEISNSYIQSLIINGTLDYNKTVLEQIGILTITNENLAKSIAIIALEEIETKENIGIWYGNKLIYSYNNTAYENASNILTERHIISGLGGLNGTGFLSGYSARAFLSNSYRTVYSYFGGYIGDGNISKRIEYYGNISSAEIELTINNNFTLYINGINSGNYSKSPSDTIPVKYSLDNYKNNFISGANKIEFRGFNLYIAGGYVKITYLTNANASQETKKYLTGVDGIVNLYDGLSVNGQLNSMDVFLHYKIPYQSFLAIGNITIWNGSSSTENTTSISNSQIMSLLNYNQLSNKTTPIRFGSQNFSFNSNNTGGNADVILITDVSGSMNWRMNSDTSGIERNCTDPLTFSDPSTRRISVARCLDLQFVSTILQSSTNRVGLVSLGSNSNTYVNLTNNATLLNNTINNYVANQMTCISCAINRAYLILQGNSNSSRKKYVIAMTDGVANMRSTPQCYNIDDSSITNISSTTAFAVGDTGVITAYTNAQWTNVKNASTTNLNGIDLLNDTYGFAVGDSYRLFRWNGTSWYLQQDLGNDNLYGVNIFNRTLGFAVGDAGKIAKWNGTSWAEYQDTGNNNFKDIKLLNATLGFAVANAGKIFRWNGSNTNWYEYQDLGDDNLKSIDMFNGTYGIIVSGSRTIFVWNGASWSLQQTLSSGSPTDVDIYNRTLAFISTNNGRIYKKIGNNAWTQETFVALSPLNTIRIINNTFGFALGDSIGGLTLWNGTRWNNTYPEYYYQGNSSTGLNCNDNALTSCTLLQNIATLNANYSSCRVNREQNATVHSIGFGPVSTCGLSSRTLLSIATCGNGSYYASDNATQLQQIYANISQNIVQLSYAQQTATVSGNATGILYPDSYINLNYTFLKNPFGVIIPLEKQFENTTQGNFSIYPNSTILDAQVTSYSGPKWTDKLKINGNTVCNISKYGNSYISLGDPYSILIPSGLVLNQNDITLTTAVAPTNVTVGSASNKIIYTLAKNFSSFSPILAIAQGCQWNIQFEDYTNITVRIPSAYNGSSQCYFPPNGGFTHDPNDAFQVAVYNLLRQLDLNGNQLIDPKITEQALQIDISQVNGIPYTWQTEVQIRTWT